MPFRNGMANAIMKWISFYMFEEYASQSLEDVKKARLEEKKVHCLWCKERFLPTRKWQRFCKPNCGLKWHRAKEHDKVSVFAEMVDDSQPIEVKDDPKKPTIDVFASFQAASP